MLPPAHPAAACKYRYSSLAAGTRSRLVTYAISFESGAHAYPSGPPSENVGTSASVTFCPGVKSRTAFPSAADTTRTWLRFGPTKWSQCRIQQTGQRPSPSPDSSAPPHPSCACCTGPHAATSPPCCTPDTPATQTESCCESGDHIAPSASVLTCVNCSRSPKSSPPPHPNPPERSATAPSAALIRRHKQNLLPIRREPPPTLALLPERNLLAPPGSARVPHTLPEPSRSLGPHLRPQWHHPQMRGLRIRRQVHIHRREHHPLPARRDLRIAHPLHPLQIFKRHRSLPRRRRSRPPAQTQPHPKPIQPTTQQSISSRQSNPRSAPPELPENISEDSASS